MSDLAGVSLDSKPLNDVPGTVQAKSKAGLYPHVGVSPTDMGFDSGTETIDRRAVYGVSDWTGVRLPPPPPKSE